MFCSFSIRIPQGTKLEIEINVITPKTELMNGLVPIDYGSSLFSFLCILRILGPSKYCMAIIADGISYTKIVEVVISHFIECEI